MTIDYLREKYGSLFLERDRDANKGTYGKLLIIAGSPGMAGAAYLSGLAAFSCGIGMVKFLGPEENRVILQTLLPEAMYGSLPADTGYDEGPLEVDGYHDAFDDVIKSSLKWADYVILGPGLSKKDEAVQLVYRLFKDDMAALIREKILTIIDADALNIIADERLELRALDRGSGTNVVITPHVGEMHRLLRSDSYEDSHHISYIKENAARLSSEYSLRHGVMTVLKDHVTTVSVPPDIYRIDSGSGAMAKAGSGDVLTGFLAGTAAVLKGDTIASVPLGVYLHGLAGTLAAERNGPHSILASDIARMAAAAFAKFGKK